MDGVTNHQLTTYLFDSLPEDATLQIIGKLRPFQLKLLTGTCTNLNNMREKWWKLLSSRDFRWLCSPSLEISPNKTWQGLYKILAAIDSQNIAWQHSSFELNITGEKLGAGLDAQGNFVAISKQGWIQSWSLDGTPLTSITIPSAIWSQIENPNKLSVSLLPKNHAFLFTPTHESQRRGYLYMNSSLHPIANMTLRDTLFEIDHNVFIFVHRPTSYSFSQVIYLISIDNPNMMKTTPYGSGEAFPLYDSRFMIVGDGWDWRPVSIYSSYADGWSLKRKGSIVSKIAEVLPDGLIVATDFELADEWVHSFWTLETPKDEINFKRVKSVHKNTNGRVEQLPNGDVVFVSKDKSPEIEIWSINPAYTKHKRMDCKLSPKDEVFVHPTTGQILVLSPPQGNNTHYLLHVYSPSLFDCNN